MTIPASIFTALSSLQTQVQKAQPLTSANRSTIVALQLNAVALVNSIQAQLVLSSVLDTFTQPPDPITLVSSILGVSSAATDQANLSLMRGVTGRALENLDRLV